MQTFKPPLSATINQGHPLAQGMVACFLINELGGPLIDLVSGYTLDLTAGTTRVTTPFGTGLNCNGTSFGASALTWNKLKEVGNGSAGNGSNAGWTLLWRGSIASSPSAFSGLIVNSFDTARSQQPFSAYTLTINATSDGYFVNWNDQAVLGGSGKSYSATAGSAFDGSERQIVAATKGATGNYLYENANLILSAGVNVQTSNPAFASDARTGIGTGSSTDAGNTKSIARHAYFWRRALTQGEVQWLWEQPYAFINVKPRIYFAIGLALLTQTAADSINNLADTVALSNGAAANYGVGASDRITFSDSLGITGPPPDYFILLGESISNIQDSPRVVVGLTEQLSDTINNFADAFSKAIGIPISTFDSLQFNWADAISTAYIAPLSLTKADTINNLLDSATTVAPNVKINIAVADTLVLLTDAIRIWSTLKLTQGDNLVLSDAIQLRFKHLLAIAEALPAFVDVPRIQRATKPAFADTLNNLNDAVSFAMAVELRASKSDSFTVTDSVSLELIGSYNQPGFIDRIRRYLGDLQSS